MHTAAIPTLHVDIKFCAGIIYALFLMVQKLKYLRRKI